MRIQYIQKARKSKSGGFKGRVYWGKHNADTLKRAVAVLSGNDSLDRLRLYRRRSYQRWQDLGLWARLPHLDMNSPIVGAMFYRYILIAKEEG